MSSCFKQTKCLPRGILFSQRTSFLKFFSGFSSAYDTVRNNTGKDKFSSKKLNVPEQIVRHRYFSLQSIYSFYDSVNSSEASKLTKHILLETHDFGLSWCGTIIATSAVLKLFISFPCAIYQQYLMSKLELTKVELDGTVQSLRKKILDEAYRNKWSETKCQIEFRKRMREQWKILVVKNNCHPFKITILFIIQFPFWLLTTLTIREFAKEVYEGRSDSLITALEFQVGGPFWSKNLALPDPTYILPIINFLCLLACNELSLSTKAQEKINKNFTYFVTHRVVPNFLRLFAVAFFFISASSFSAVSLFWASNSVIALAQNLLIKSPKVRRFFQIPKSASEIDKPYREIWNRFSDKCSKFTTKKK